jgi:YVTN family beta-propeller protein
VSVLPNLPVGSELLGYRIEGVLGRGGMGIVYLAEDRRLKRRVALKLLWPEFAADERFRERLLAESELAASLDHPSIVPIYEAGEVDGQIFISMRYVDGSDLKAVLRRGPLAPEYALGLVSQVASALDAAHARGLVHRDVKPSNVLIAPKAGHEGTDHVYLADFGLTKRLAEEEEGVVGEELLGTVEYVAPEQIRGEDVDGRADVYSLGCLLYECLAGKPPYAGRSAVATLFAHLREEPPTLPRLENVLPRALAKAPADRYETCRELVDAFRQALGLAEPKRARWPRLAALVAAALATAAALLTFFLVGRAGPGTAAATGRLVRIDPGTNTAKKTIAIGKDPTAVTVGAGSIWMTTAPESSVWRIEPRTLETVRIPVSGTPVGIAVQEGASSGQNVGSANDGVVFVAGNAGVAMIDATSGQPAAGRQSGGIAALGASVIAGGPDGVWMVASDTVYRLTGVAFGVGKADAVVRIPQGIPRDEAHMHNDVAGIAVGEGSVWVVGDAVDRRLWRIDPKTARIQATIPLPFAPGGVATGFGGVWVTAQLDDRIIRLDPKTNRVVRTIAVGRAPWGVAVGAGAVWVANTIDETVSRIDPSTNRVVSTIRVGASPKQLAVGEGSVWVAAFAG